MSRRWILAFGALAMTAGWSCSDERGGEIPEDPCDDPNHVAAQALAHDGPWRIPSGTLAAGDTQYVENTQAGPWRGESGCGGGMTPGAAELKTWLQGNFPQLLSIGGYSCRPIVGNESMMSVHATGRALDLMLPLDNGQADNDLGDPIGNFLIEHAEEIGIQLIIWDRWAWNAGRNSGDKSNPYTGSHPHHDHLHIELSLEGADRRTPFFQGSMDPPDLPACQVIPAQGGTVDDAGPCFSAFGPAQFWRRVDGQGIDGRLLWTNAFQNESPSNWARWRLHFEEAGQYTVEFYALPEFGVHDAVRYLVRHGDQESTTIADQSAVNGWQALGVFDFAQGGGQHVELYDNVMGPVAANQRITADAVRLTRLDADPDPEPTPEPTPQPDPEPDDLPTPQPEPEPQVSEPEPTVNPGDFAEPEPQGEAPISQTTLSKQSCAQARPAAPPALPGPAWILAALAALTVIRRR